VDGTYGGCGKERNCKKHRKDRKACYGVFVSGIPKDILRREPLS